jgi:hypothetical protein
MYLGLMGFDAASEAALKRWVSHNTLHTTSHSTSPARDIAPQNADWPPVWHIVDAQEADALLIRGAAVIDGSDATLQFHRSFSKGSAVTGASSIQLDQIKQPFALCDADHLRALCVDLKDHPVFDLRDASSLQRTMAHFETILRPLRTLYALSMELTARQEELDAAHTFHLEHQGKLHAVIDAPNHRVFVRASSQPSDIHGCAWLPRPKSANFAPAHFLECHIQELAWVFAMHCLSVNLPKRYTAGLIYMRRKPLVRSSMLSPRQVKLLDLLGQQPHAFTQLQRKLPDTAQWIERDLFALYLTRSISTQAPARQGLDHSTQPPSEPDDNGQWMLTRMGRLMRKLKDGLGSQR